MCFIPGVINLRVGIFQLNPTVGAVTHLVFEPLDLLLKLSNIVFLLLPRLLCGLSVLKFLHIPFVLSAWLLVFRLVGLLLWELDSVEFFLSDLNFSLDSSHSLGGSFVSDVKLFFSHFVLDLIIIIFCYYTL